MIHTVGEQTQGNKTRTLEIGGRESAKRKGGGGRVGKLDSTSSLRLDKDPRWAREVGNVRLYSCRSSVCWRVVHAPRVCAVLGCWRPGVAWQRSPARCLLPCIRALREKENFQLFHFVQPLKMVHFVWKLVDICCSKTCVNFRHCYGNQGWAETVENQMLFFKISSFDKSESFNSPAQGVLEIFREFTWGGGGGHNVPWIGLKGLFIIDNGFL